MFQQMPKSGPKTTRADCRERLKLTSNAEKQKEKEEGLRRLQELRGFAGEGVMPGDDEKVKQFKSLFGGGTMQQTSTNLVNERQAEVDAMREENNTRGLKLRNRQLHHATEMYRRRKNLDKVGEPPHDGKCANCKTAARVNPTTFQSNMSRCSKCLLVRCEYQFASLVLCIGVGFLFVMWQI